MLNGVRFVDLFSGAGLFSQGFIAEGFEAVLAVDVDPLAVESYNRNVAPVAQQGNVSTPFSTELAPILIAGPPCQGFSTLGRRDAADERNLLCLEIPAWARCLDSQVVVTENVPPFVNSVNWTKMVRTLERDGFEIGVWLLDAANHGTPQRRRRAFTVASKIGMPRPPVPESPLVPSSVAFRDTVPNDPLSVWPSPTPLALGRMSLVPPKGDKRDILLTAPSLCPPSWHRLGTQEATDSWGRIDPDRPANTIRCRFQNPSVGRYTHPTEDRVLSLREGARLQGIPDSWTFAGGREAIARQIGNGVPIPLARAIAKSIRHLLSEAVLRSPSRAA